MNPNEYNNMNNGQMPMSNGQAPMGNGPQPNQNPGLGVFANEMDPSSNRLNSQAQGGSWASPQQTGPSNTFGGSMQQMPQQGGPVNTMSGNMGMAQPMQQQPMQQPMQQMPQQQSMQQMPPQQPIQQQPMMQQANVQGQGVQNPYQPYPAYQPQKMDLKTTLENNKKILMIAACCFAGFILFIIFINIIATKTLKCTNTMDSDYLGISYTYTEKAKFKFGKIKLTESTEVSEFKDYKTTTLTKVKYSNRRPKAYYREAIIEYDDKDDLDEAYKEAKSAKKEGINKYCSKYNVKKSGKKLTISCTVDRDYIGKVSDSAIELITYKEMKENLIDDDYTCK